MKHAAILFPLLLALPVIAQAAPRTALERDTADYAVASCLWNQTDPVLKQEGGYWAGAIVQRGRGAIEPFTAIADAVKADMAANPVPMVHVDEEFGGGRAVPGLQCGEIIDRPTVDAAIMAARRALAEAYAAPE